MTRHPIALPASVVPEAHTSVSISQPLQSVWRSWPQLEQGEQKSPGGGGRGNSSSLSRHGVPVTSLTVRGWRLLAAPVTGDAWAEICLRCSLWGQNSVTHAPHTWEGFINHLHQTERHLNYLVLFWVWLTAAEVVFSATFGVCIQCSALAWTLTDLRPEVKRKTRCDEKNPSQQQLEYWQQHMQHVSSWASGAIISDKQTNTWHWFDLSICTLECEGMGGLQKEP